MVRSRFSTPRSPGPLPVALLCLAATTLGPATAAAPAAAQDAATAAAQDASPDPGPRCTPTARLEGRLSPYASVRIELGDGAALLCYGRPSSRGRRMIGGPSVPFGKLWRTGANEPSILHLPFDAEVAGIVVRTGSYSIYTVPGSEEWVIIVNASISQWGHESQYTGEVQAREVGRASLPSVELAEPVETLTILGVQDPEERHAGLLRLEWEHTRVDIPIRRKEGGER